LKLDLASVAIPLLAQTTQQAKSYRAMDSIAAEANAIFMLKIKIDNQLTKVFLEAPNKILDIQHSNVLGNIDSYYDKITIEFYDVINE